MREGGNNPSGPTGGDDDGKDEITQGMGQPRRGEVRVEGGTT